LRKRHTGAFLKQDGFGKLLKISPRQYRNKYARFINGDIPIYSRLSLTQARIARFTKVNIGILTSLRKINKKMKEH